MIGDAHDFLKFWRGFYNTIVDRVMEDYKEDKDRFGMMCKLKSLNVTDDLIKECMVLYEEKCDKDFCENIEMDMTRLNEEFRKGLE